MYACLCAQVTDQQWNEALAQAGHDFHTASAQTGAGTGCGGCRLYLVEQSASLPGLAVLPSMAAENRTR